MPNNLFSISPFILTSKSIALHFEEHIKKPSLQNKPGKDDQILYWKDDPNHKKAERLAEKNGSNLIRLDDGFICSVSGSNQKLSICYDSSKTHCNNDNVIHALIPLPLTTNEYERASQAISFKNTHYISKHNEIPVLHINTMGYQHKRKVLIIDQVIGSESSESDGSNMRTFKSMIIDALADFPDAQIFIALHPNHQKIPTFATQIETTWLDDIDGNDRILFINTPINVIQLINQVDAAYTISSLTGFDAILLGKNVYVYGRPFYAGYGVTIDKHCDKRGSCSIQQIFYAAYIRHSTYINPITGTKCDLETVMEIVAANISINPDSQVVIKTPRLWQRKFLKTFMRRHSIRSPQFSKRFYTAQWGYCDRNNFDYFIEEGILRSRGLNSPSAEPHSLVIDCNGPYYDHKSESTLEKLLNERTFSERELERAKQLQTVIINDANTKLSATPQKINNPKKEYVVVIGQTETSKSINTSGCGFNNVDAVKIAKQRYPDCHIIYRPHPDAIQNRNTNQCELAASKLADEVSTGGSFDNLLTQAKCVVTVTSNSGLEALIRGVKVYCLGYPYYYGWGLTEDESKLPNRSRKLSIEELIAGVLILYPDYYDYVTDLFCRVEDIVEKLKSDSEISATKVTVTGKPFHRIRNLLAQLN